MSRTTDDVSDDELRKPAWWEEIFDLDAAVPAAEAPADAASWAPLFARDGGDTDANPTEPNPFAEQSTAAPSGPDGSSRQRTTYAWEKLNEIAAALRNLPAPDSLQRTVNGLGAVKRLREQIVSAQKRGYTLDQIAEVLSTEGLKITGATLRVYLKRLKNRGKTASKTRARANLPLVLRGRIRA